MVTIESVTLLAVGVSHHHLGSDHLAELEVQERRRRRIERYQKLSELPSEMPMDTVTKSSWSETTKGCVNAEWMSWV